MGVSEEAFMAVMTVSICVPPSSPLGRGCMVMVMPVLVLQASLSDWRSVAVWVLC